MDIFQNNYVKWKKPDSPTPPQKKTRVHIVWLHLDKNLENINYYIVKESRSMVVLGGKGARV